MRLTRKALVEPGLQHVEHGFVVGLVEDLVEHVAEAVAMGHLLRRPLGKLRAAGRCHEPVVAGRLMFVGSSRTDSVTAYDTRTGESRWRFLADGPVRFAPLVHAGKLYFVSDDGHLYCLDAATGALQWKFRGGPTDRRILGNGRLVSAWPAVEADSSSAAAMRRDVMAAPPGSEPGW